MSTEARSCQEQFTDSGDSSRLLEMLRGRVSEQDYYLAEQRTLGRDWASLSVELNTPSGELRRRLARALDQALHGNRSPRS